MIREISPSTTLQSLQIVAVKLSILAILPKLQILSLVFDFL
jgi:hypothetical protein